MPSSEDDPVYIALKAEAPLEIRSTEKHAPVAVGMPTPVGEHVLDRNGKPTDEVRFDVTKPFEITLQRLRHIRAHIERDVRQESADTIRDLRKQLDLAKADRKNLQVERDELVAVARTYDRAGREEKVQERIRLTIDERTAILQNEIRTLHSEVASLKSENAELREAKRRLKAARQGSR